MKYKKLYTSLILSGIILLSNSISHGIVFEDTETHWSRSYVERLSDEGVISGYSDNTFKPNNNITREEVSAILARYMKGSGGTKTMKDIVGRWSELSISYLMDNGIINGYPDGTFKPTKNITRAEFAAIIDKYLDKIGKNQGSSGVFVSDIKGNWAEQSIRNVIGSGYMSGYQDSSFKPDRSITRGEVATVVALIDGAFKTKDVTNNSEFRSEVDRIVSEVFPGRPSEFTKEITDDQILSHIACTFYDLEYYFQYEPGDILDNYYGIKARATDVKDFAKEYFGKDIIFEDGKGIWDKWGSPVAYAVDYENLILFVGEYEKWYGLSNYSISSITQVEENVIIAKILFKTPEREADDGSYYQIRIEKINNNNIITESLYVY